MKPRGFSIQHWDLWRRIRNLLARQTDGRTAQLSPKQRIWNIVPLLPLVLPILLLLPGSGSFPYPSQGAPFSDLTISHYPNGIFMKRAILEYHTIPLWSPTILSGYPFAADPLSGLWYPPGWLALVFPLPLGFNLLVALHLVWGGLGMYRLLRSKGMVYAVALFGGLAFEFYPKIFAHFGAGHLTLLYAIPWTPWLLLAEEKGYLKPGNFLQRLFAPGVILALIFLADPRWAAYAGILWLAYGMANRRQIGSLLGQAGLAALLSAPLAVPLLEYTRLSTRTNLKPDEVLAFSLPPARLLGFVFPDFGGYQEWALYAGGIVLLLSCLAIIWRGFRGWTGFWGIVTIVSIVISLGSSVPGLSVIAGIPGLGLLRVPSRALFLTGFSLAILAASGLDCLLANSAAVDKRKAGLLLVGMCGFTITLAIGVWALTRALPLSFAWGTAVILAGSVWMGLFFAKRIPVQFWVVGLVGLCVVDWSVVDLSEFAYRKEAEVLSEGGRIGAYLAEQPGLFRVYSPSYSLPQQIAAVYGIELADGVDPLQLKAYAGFMEKATGVPVSGYSVTVPPFENGDPDQDNLNYRPDPALLGLLNVGYVVSEFDLPVEGLALRERFGDTRIYQNMKELPRAWVQNSEGLPSGDVIAAEISRWTPNHVDLRANGPGLLVLSEIDYPGWRVFVDGNARELEAAEGLLRAVRLDEGAHEVEFVYRPVSVYVGLGLGLIGLLLVLAGLI
jgi:hypothetical protein